MSDEPVFDSTEFGEASGTDIIEMLKTGVPTVVEETVSKAITIYVAEDDTNEIKNVKDNVEFVVNSAREAVSFLMTLGKQTGNARYFEAVNALLNTITGATGQLMNVDRKKKNPLPENLPPGTSLTQTNNTTNIIGMSTADALRLTSQKDIKQASGVIIEND
jgi:hypothetical protein